MAKKEPAGEIAERTINVYVGSRPTGDIIINCIEGEPIPAALVKQYQDKLVAVGALSEKPVNTREVKDGPRKR